MTIDKKAPSYDDNNRIGVLSPLLQYRFRVLFGHEGTTDLYSLLTQQVVYCKTDMSNTTLNIRLRQPIIPGVFSMLNKFIDRSSRYGQTIFVEPMNGTNDAAICTLEFHDCKCTKHSANFDYSEGGILFHDMEFSYRYMSEYQPVDWAARVDDKDEKVV